MNEGAVQLRGWVDQLGSQVLAARKLKVSKQRLSNWLRGKCRPTEKMRGKIQTAALVSVHLWFVESGK